MDGNFTLGHKNVVRNDEKITNARETFEWFINDFSSCSDMTPGASSGNDGDAKDDEDDGSDYYDLEVDDSDAVDTDNCGVDNDGTADRTLRLSEGTAVRMYGDLVHLNNSKIHFWDEVAHDARCAIRGVNVSTRISQKGSRGILTQNMWRQGVVNLTDIIRRNCTRAGDSENRVGASLEACCSLRRGICGMSEVFGRSGLGDELGLTDNFEFRESMFGYGCKNIMEVCASFPDCSRRETGLSDELISASAALHKLECTATNSAVGWLRLRFDMALDFVKSQFTLALNSLNEAESQVKEALLKAVSEARETLCTWNTFLLKEVPAVDELKKWIDVTKGEAGEVRKKFSLSAEKVSLATSKISEVMESVDKVMPSVKESTQQVRVAYGQTPERCKSASVAVATAVSLVEKASVAAHLLSERHQKFEMLMNERSVWLEKVHKEIIDGLGNAFVKYESEMFSKCKYMPNLTVPGTPIGDVDVLLSALVKVGSYGNTNGVEAVLSECKNQQLELNNVMGDVRAAAGNSIREATEVSQRSDAALASAKGVLIELLGKQKTQLCATVLRLEEMGKKTTELRQRAVLMRDSAARHHKRATEAEERANKVGTHVESSLESLSIVRDECNRVKATSSDVDNAVLAIIRQAEAATQRSERQIKTINDAFSKAIRNITGDSIKENEKICGSSNAYTIKTELRHVLESILSLASLHSVTDLQAKIDNMQQSVEDVRRLRNAVKKHADAAVVAALKAQQEEDNRTACVPLFEHFLHVLE
ncbi:hypothetical protein, conserved in T. vivax [Trypanosoma vivax Y486]|uniref:Uncharacterized protein n=1 Tax=Trypanosoma vivax (strain Y486) TaxID=1055687 RepID=F9WTA5_TRYVY|nr:hypothetical protein, conserved in T. vivax [Trypanosoma vivax Y486]|eukprot:CCD20798.1 hypothetical protein, conserved in T. vivax [Trypanosoma vivax Y486]